MAIAFIASAESLLSTAAVEKLHNESKTDFKRKVCNLALSHFGIAYFGLVFIVVARQWVGLAFMVILASAIAKALSYVPAWVALSSSKVCSHRTSQSEIAFKKLRIFKI